MVGEAGTGKDALCRAREVGPDIVLLDIELPDQDGYAVARVLKQTPRPPVIVFLTLHGDPATRRRASEAGGDAFVEKGICCATLVDRLRAAFAARPQLPQGPLPDP